MEDITIQIEGFIFQKITVREPELGIACKNGEFEHEGICYPCAPHCKYCQN
jgi:hypothetical protein